MKWITFTPGGALLFLLTGRIALFDVRNISPRKNLNRLARHGIDRTLFRAKLASLQDADYRYKTADDVYTRDEVKTSRLCVKSNNGLIFLNPILREMYSDVSFVGMTRHPLAVYESWKRRGVVKGPDEFGVFYNTIASRMIGERENPDYLLVRFENVLADPYEAAEEVYRFLGLPFHPDTCLRFKAKPHHMADGRYGSSRTLGAYYWIRRDQVGDFLERDINQLQIDALAKEEKARVLSLTAEVRGVLGYRDDGSVEDPPGR